jgi:hypothetical protein
MMESLLDYYAIHPMSRVPNTPFKNLSVIILIRKTFYKIFKILIELVIAYR